MAANDNATVTIDTNEWIYTDKDGITQHTVTNGQTIEFDLTAAGTGTNYRMSHDAAGNNLVTCTDGTRLVIESDPAFTWFHVPTDATKQTRAGAMRIRENDGKISDFELDITINNVDEPTEITALTATAKDNTMRNFTWTTVTAAQ